MKNIKYLFILLIVILSISFSQGKISTPSDYYDLIKFDNYQQFPNRTQNDNHNQHDFLYPDICYGTTRNNVNGTISFNTKAFPGSHDSYKNLYITQGATMIISKIVTFFDDFLNILCIEGSLIIEPNDVPFYVGAIIILPGGSLTSQRQVVIRDLYEPNSLVDPLGFFPGILSLGGNLTLSSPNKLIYPATRLDSTLLSVPGLIGVAETAYIFSKFFPLGVAATLTLIAPERVGIFGATISENDKNIYFVAYREYPAAVSLETGSSIYITANSNVHIENYFVGSFGKTTNQEYNDTELVFDANDSNIVTKINVGTNQRFRTSLFIENSSNVNIKGSAISETKETRAPLVISESRVNIQDCLIASKSGSTIIAQYGTELIESSNNIYYLSKAENGKNQIQPSSAYMNYGFEGNGIYSLSPNIISTSDTFIGHSNVFNFNFISNRSSVTGFNYDCFAPCTLTSTLISSLSQFPVDFKIKTPSFISLPFSSSNEQTEELLLNINNGNQTTRYFTINGLSISDSIKLNLNNSALILSNVTANGGFNIHGTVGKLNIVNSTIGSNLKLTSNSTVISSSYIHGEFGSNVSFKGSSYYYEIDNLNIDLPILSTFPIDTYQMSVNSTVNFMVQIGSSTFNGIGIKCEFISIGSNEVNSSIAVDSDGKCILPLKVTSESITNLKVNICSSATPSTYYYSFIFPTIYSFNNYSLTSAWKIAPPAPIVPSNSNLKSYIHLVTSTQIDSQFDKECTKSNGCEILSNQIKIESSLPSSSNEYLPIGISTSVPLEPLNINLAVSELKNNQIQLYFTSFNPVDSNPSPLSIYLNNEVISIFEKADQQHFKKDIYFENTGQLQTVQLSIVSRGDIYLTGAAIYSTFIHPIVIPPTIIPNIPDFPDIPPFSDNFNPKVLYIVIFVGVGLLVLSVIGILLAFKKHRINLKNGFKIKELEIEKRIAHDIEMEEIRKKQLYIDENMTDTGVSFKTNSTEEIITDSYISGGSNISNNNNNNGSISIGDGGSNSSIDINIDNERDTKHNYYYYKKKYLKYKENNNNNYYYNYNNNNNNNLNYNYNTNEEMANQFGIEPEIKENIQKYMIGLRRLYGTFPLNESSSVQNITSFPTITGQLQGINKNPDRYNTSGAILQRTQESLWYRWDSPEFPITISKRTLHFGNSGRKCQLDKTFYDQIQVTNNTNRSIKVVLYLPTDNGAGYCTTAAPFVLIDPHKTVKINFAIILHCTTKWYEKFAVQVFGYGHTFLLMHLESVVTTKLDYRELEFEEYVGKGSHGTVYKGRYRAQTIAIKLIRVNIENINEAYREIDIMSRIRHQNCVQMVGCVASPAHLCIVSQFAKMGSLGDVIHKKGTKLTLKQKVRIALDIAVGCQYLHGNGIVHRDLKPENVLIIDLNPEASVCVRIADFGTCKEIGEIFNPSANNNIYLTESVGTPIYQSNEVLSKINYNNSTDVYSFGMSFYELMIEELPFNDHKDVWELPSLIISGIRPTKGMDTFDNDISSLIIKCWNPVASDRPTFDQIVVDLKEISERIN